MNVLVNRWLGDGFESDVKCVCCGKLATTVQLPVFDPDTPSLDLVNVCGACLTEALNTLSKVLLEHSTLTVVDLASPERWR